MTVYTTKIYRIHFPAKKERIKKKKRKTNEGKKRKAKLKKTKRAKKEIWVKKTTATRYIHPGEVGRVSHNHVEDNR